MNGPTPRRPIGNKVVRRRKQRDQIIDIGGDVRQVEVPTTTSHAKRFVLAVAVIMFLGASLLMLPIASESGDTTSFIDALFVSVSAFSVTGLVTVDTQNHWSLFGEAVILILIQLGGFGFMAGTSLILMTLGRGSSLRASLMMQDGSPTMTLHDVTSVSLRIVRYMLIVEAVGAAVLTGYFLQHESPLNALWFGVFHSISAFCNAGFDLNGNFESMIRHSMSPVILFTIAALIQAGALSFMVVSDVWRVRKWRPLQLDTKLVLITNFALIAIAMALFGVVEWNTTMTDIHYQFRPIDAWFQSIAARTAGFSSVDWGDAHSSTLYLWTVIMMVGGAAGSTAGGVKLATVAVLVIAVLSTLRGQPEPQAFGRRISYQTVARAMALVALFMTTHFLLALGLVLSEDTFNHADFSFVALMFESMSALATVGLSTGITPDLTSAGKAILIVGMFIGRLGPITAVYALQRKQQQARYRFAEGTVRIG